MNTCICQLYVSKFECQNDENRYFLSTVNVEIFAGLNVHGFQAYCEGFPVNA